MSSRAIGANKKREYSFLILLALARAGWIRPRTVESVQRKVAHIAPGWNIHSS